MALLKSTNLSTAQSSYQCTLKYTPTWNVRTLYESTRLDMFRKEIVRLTLSILGINGTSWINNGDFMIDYYKLIYAAGDKHEKGFGLMMDTEMSTCMLDYWTSTWTSS